MKDLLTQMGTRIWTRRKQMRLTQEELAERANITPQTISSAELGKKALRPENIIQICEALEISTDYLLLGRVTEDDHVILQQKLIQLTPVQYRHLETIIDAYISAFSEYDL